MVYMRRQYRRTIITTKKQSYSHQNKRKNQKNKQQLITNFYLKIHQKKRQNTAKIHIKKHLKKFKTAFWFNQGRRWYQFRCL